MNRIQKAPLWAVVITAVSLALSSCGGLAGDITPPPGQAATPAQDTATLAVPSPPPQDTPESSPAPTAELAEGSVAVQVADMSGSNLLEQGLEISLEGYDQFQQVYQAELTVPASGQVLFEEVPFQPDRVFFASVPYGGAIYRSEIIQVDQGTDSLNLSVSIYETTTDTSGLIIDRLHVLVDFAQADQAQVAEIYILSNLGQATIVSPSPGEPSVVFSLPDGADAIQFEDGALGQRFLLTEDGFGDTVSIPPGAGVYQVLVSYTLPYLNDRLDFDQVLDYPLSAAVVMVPAGQIRVSSTSLEDLGEQSLASGAVRIYASGSLGGGESLSFRVSGNPGAETPSLNDRANLGQIGIIAAGVLGILLLGAGSWLLVRNRRRREGPAHGQPEGISREEIIDSILALEDLYQNGEISQQDYEKKRAELKDSLGQTGSGDI